MFRSSCFLLLALPALSQAQALPSELDCIPRDAMGFISIRGDLLKNETLKPVRDFIVKQDPTLLKTLEAQAGFKLDDVARATFLFPALDAPLSPPLIFITLNQPYDKAKLLAKVKASSNRVWMAMPSTGIARPSSSFTRPDTFQSPPSIPKGEPSFPPKKPEVKPRSTYQKAPQPKDFPKEESPPSAPKDDEPALKPTIEPEDRVFNSFVPGKPDLGAAYYYLGPTGNILICFDERTLLFIPDGDADGGRTMLKLLPSLLRPAKKGPLDDALALAAGKHALVVGVKVAGLPKFKNLPEPIAHLLASAESFTLTADLSTELTVSLRIGFTDAAAALDGKKQVVAFVDYLKEEVPALRKSLAKSSSGRILATFMGQWEMLLSRPTVTQKESMVEASASVKIDEALTKALEKALVEMKFSKQQTRSQNNLKQMGLAILNYHDAYGQLPFPGINAGTPVRAGVKPTLSWRVAILPFIEETRLYRQFKLDEPWDSEHNKKLIPLMPKIYAPVNGIKAPKGQTFYQIFQGASAIRPGMRIFNFTDGLSNTIFVVESDDSVPWTQPEDILYNPKKPLPKLGGLFGGDFNVLMGDGSVRWFSKTISERKLRALITPDGGEVTTEE